MKRACDPRVDLLKELAEPLRLRVVDRLAQAGPATVSRLAVELDVTLPQLSNHLRRLRFAGLVTARRTGRQAVYELADDGIELLLPLLDRITGRIAIPLAERDGEPTPSRTCYGHLAGPLGVGVYRALRDREAIRELPDGMVEPGPAARKTFGAVGVDVASIRPTRRRLAFQCLDATERAPHLAGALGDALADALFASRWIERVDGSRAIRLTRRGAEGLRGALDVDLSRGGRGSDPEKEL